MAPNWERNVVGGRCRPCGKNCRYIFFILRKECKEVVGVAARLAQSAERKALNLVVVGSSPTVGALTPKNNFLHPSRAALDFRELMAKEARRL